MACPQQLIIKDLNPFKPGTAMLPPWKTSKYLSLNENVPACCSSKKLMSTTWCTQEHLIRCRGKFWTRASLLWFFVSLRATENCLGMCVGRLLPFTSNFNAAIPQANVSNSGDPVWLPVFTTNDGDKWPTRAERTTLRFLVLARENWIQKIRSFARPNKNILPQQQEFVLNEVPHST